MLISFSQTSYPAEPWTEREYASTGISGRKLRSTTWRVDTVIPLLEEHKISYFSSHIAEWHEELVGLVIEGQAITGRDLLDLKRGRVYLRDIAARHGCTIYQDVTEATHALIEYLKT
jgi:hypothetical protein